MILRVFPRRTMCTPDDIWVRIGSPGMFDPPHGTTAIYISVTFTWDIEQGALLYSLWAPLHPHVYIGGPAFGHPGGDFVRGRFMAEGNVITSRGCPNSCSYCMVPHREGPLRQLPITEGWKVQDNNLLACDDEHIAKVCEMLVRQPVRGVLAGGLEARRLTRHHVYCFRDAKVERLYFAYDRSRDIEHLRKAGELLVAHGFSPEHHLYCYVLIGYPGDTMQAAEIRLRETLEAGFMPFAMLYRSPSWRRDDPAWAKFQREWVRPAIVRAKNVKEKATP